MIALLIAAFVGHGSVWYDGPPPARYQHDTWARIHFASPAKVTRICSDRKPPKGWYVDACQIGDSFDLWLANPCPIHEEYAQTLCHELGHIEGWSANHPGARGAR